MAHTITVSAAGDYPHGAKQRAEVTVLGDGGIEHFIDTFRAALVAAGFSTDTARRLGIVEYESPDLAD